MAVGFQKCLLIESRKSQGVAEQLFKKSGPYAVSSVYA